MNYINMPDYVKMQNPDVLALIYQRPFALILTYDLGKYEATI